MKTRNLIATMVAMLPFALASSAGATTLVYDDFSGSSGTNLVGTTADIGGAWIATGAAPTNPIKANGSVAADPTSPGEGVNAYQAFSFVVGRKYTLSADLNLTSIDSNWLALGFIDNTSTLPGSGHIIGQNVYAWMLFTGDGTIYRVPGPTTTGITSIASGQADPKSLKIELDTTTPSYTASFYIDGVFNSSATIGTPALADVFIATIGATGTWDNFLLQDDIAPPSVTEPSTCALGLIGLAGLGLIAWRRRKAAVIGGQ